MKFNISNMTVALAAAALGAASCTANYEDINRNPYEVTAEDMERDGYAMRSFMTTMQSWVIPADVNQCQFTDLLLGGPYGGYIADANSGFNAGKFSTYDPQSNWSPVFYRVVYTNEMSNFTELCKVTEDENAIAVAKVVKVAGVHRVADTYGPIPYTQVGTGADPVPLDSEKEVFKAMFADLDAAVEVLTRNRAGMITTDADRLYGGSLERTEATGYGLCYFTQKMLESAGRGFEGSVAVVSGSGNVALYACEKAQQLGAKVVAMPDSAGYIHDPDGIDIALMKRLKEVERKRIREYAALRPNAVYREGCRGIWQIPMRPNLDFRGFSSTVASGIIRKGDEVVALPSMKRSRVKSIVTYDGELDFAFPPQAITVTLEDEIDISRGEMLVHPDNLPIISRNFEAMLVWMDEKKMDPEEQFFIKHTTNLTRAKIDKIRYKVNVNTLEQSAADALELNEIARVIFTTGKPLFFDPYSKNKNTGAFILIDPITNNTCAVGMIIDKVERKDMQELEIPEISLSKLDIGSEHFTAIEKVVKELDRQGITVKIIQ